MATKIDIIRPDDLLNLRIEAANLRVEPADPEHPVLVVEDRQQPGFLIVTFPPQTIAETAYFEFSIVKPDAPTNPDAGKSASDNEPLDPPGVVGTKRFSVAQLAHPSRLVFKVPADARIPFSTEGLLDWSALELSVNPIAAIGPNPTKEQIASAPAIREPGPTETALELPYKLLISPNRDVAWSHRPKPFSARGRTELWHTRLQLKTAEGPAELSRVNKAPLRAIWSEDYRPLNPPKTTDVDPELSRTAMSPNDRHQIVILTSAFHGYEADVDVGLPFGIGILGAGRLGKLKLTLPYVPAPFEAEQLMLTPLGGWLRSRGHWDPPHTAPPRVFRPRLDLIQIFTDVRLAQPNLPRISAFDENIVFPPGIFQPPEEILDLSEWVHVATQGRDHYVRIVYEGELWPFRHRAALIKVTERKFMQPKDGSNIIGAYLMQRLFIVVREPVKRFTKLGSPFKQVRLTTLVTPNIANPDDPDDPADPSGPNRVPPPAARSFWVKVMTSTKTRDKFRFHAVGTDKGGNEVDFTIPLMFVSRSDLPKSVTPASTAVAKDYNEFRNIESRNAVIPGQKVVFAERDQAKPNDNTQLVTNFINFVVDAEGNPPQMLKAGVKIPQVQELLGTDAPTTIRYFKSYVDNGFDAATGVFAEVVKEDPSKYKPDNPFLAYGAETLGVNFSSDKAGGFATPSMGVSTLTRSLGPLAGKVADAVANKLDPNEFFKGFTAQLFGSFDLIKLLPVASLDQNAPKLRTETQNIPNGKLLIATLDWEPEFLEPSKTLDLGVAAITKNHNGVSRLLIHGRIEKPLKLDNVAPPPATIEFNGKLNDFQVSVLKAVFINFVEFSYVSRNNKKTDVSVKLDPNKPVEFAGDLAFVEELRNAIPPGLFGKGPSLDLTQNPLGIRAGFAFALPPITVGVFTLKDVSLGAALTLPFLDGKPAFDFNVSERAHPFLLAVAIFGGGGFFHLQLDTAGMKQIEAAFEFGATAALDIGVASGEVHIMAGIYFKLERKENSTELACILSGYLRMGGSLNVLGIIKISVEFVLSFTYDSKRDKAYGRATLTVHVEVLFFSVSVELTVERAFGGSGDPHFRDFFNTVETWNEYALAFA